MSAIQLSFSLRVSSGVKTVHLLGSWDNYVGQLPLSKDKTSSKSGSWKGTFKFQGSTLEPGQRYWYYYIIDGYHVAHNPSVTSTVEPTTGRALNILDKEQDEAAAVFILEPGATLRNAIIGPAQAEGVHCRGPCTIENVWWDDVCEDAATFKGAGPRYVRG
ncbi:hypothetical protein BN1723_017826, partial [Verticillium longisporum]